MTNFLPSNEAPEVEGALESRRGSLDCATSEVAPLGMTYGGECPGPRQGHSDGCDRGCGLCPRWGQYRTRIGFPMSEVLGRCLTELGTDDLFQRQRRQ